MQQFACEHPIALIFIVAIVGSTLVQLIRGNKAEAEKAD